MPRYNTSLDSNTITGTTTISSPKEGAFTQLTGISGYTVTLPSPSAFPGRNFTFYNATSPAGVVTISTPSGSFSGIGGPNASTYNISAGNVISVTSDGSNYIVISEDGSPLTATTGAFTGNVEMTGGLSVTGSGTLSLNPASTGAINNVNIGASTRGTGAFTSLSANAAVTLTANTASSSTTTGTLVVTGGIGASGTVNATTVAATTLTGTVSTAAQPNITSLGTLSSLAVSGALTAGSFTVPTASQPNITSVGTLTGLTVTNTITGSVSGSAATATTAGTVTTAAQPNITSVGTLTALTVSGVVNMTSDSAVNIGSSTNYGGLLSVNRAQSGSPGIADLLTLRDASNGAVFNLQTFGDPTFGTANRFNYTGVYLAFRQGTTERLRVDNVGAVRIQTAGQGLQTAPGFGDDSSFRSFTGYNYKYLGFFNFRDGNRYLDIRLNTTADNIMYQFHVHGYMYNSGQIVSWTCGYTYISNSILNKFTINSGNTHIINTYRSAGGNLCLKMDRFSSGYSEGYVAVYFHSFDAGTQNAMGISAYAQNNNGGNFY
jgi:hypothetical protein